MDPLSVAASVAGLMSLAGRLVPALYSLSSAVKEADKDAQAAALEVAGMSVVLQGLQTYIIGQSQAAPQRLRLITVEHITASLTACVLTYSELDAVLEALHANLGLQAWDRAVWFLKRDSVQNLVARIQNHKMTFSCMLNILQCDSAGEAEKSMNRLCDRVDLLLRENKELSARLRNLEHLSGSGPSRRTFTSSPRNSFQRSPKRPSLDSSGSARPSVQPDLSIQSDAACHADSSMSSPHKHRPPHASAFEEQLHWSRVYRHAHANHSESSLTVDSRSALAFSMCSSLTLGDVSKISVFALPVFANDLSNPSAYTFAPPSDLAQIIDPGKVFADVAISITDDQGQNCVCGYVPFVVGKLCVFLKENATDVENIFATGWSPRGVQHLEALIETPQWYSEHFDWTAHTVQDAANVLIRYLLHLPEPVIPSAFYARFRKPLADYKAQGLIGCDNLHVAQLFKLRTVVQRYHVLIAELPASNRHLLLYLLDFLAVFAAKSDANTMTVPKLAAIFEPGVLSHDQHSFSASEKQLSQEILALLIENQHKFGPGPLTSASDIHDFSSAQS